MTAVLRLAARGPHHPLQWHDPIVDLKVDVVDGARGAHAEGERLTGDGVDRPALLGVNRVRVARTEGTMADH